MTTTHPKAGLTPFVPHAVKQKSVSHIFGRNMPLHASVVGDYRGSEVLKSREYRRFHVRANHDARLRRYAKRELFAS
jgi:hypothetical protein